MIDMAKIADLALLTIDASIGFELETFEFISMMQNHGLPCVMGVLTHLDSFKENKAIRKIKKAMKKRFWTEVYEGAKLFYLSAQHGSLYMDREVHNLSRFISVLKWKPIQWRDSHSYVLSDRYELVPETGTGLFYGYVRGSAFNQQNVFIPSYGNYTVKSMTKMDDPVPLQVTEKGEKKKGHRSLK